MCDFGAIAAIGMAMYSANQKKKQEMKDFRATKKAAEEMAAERSRQINQQSEMLLQQRLSTVAADKGKVTSMLSDSGLGGLSISQLLTNASLVANQDMDTLRINRDNSLKDVELRRKNSLITTDSGTNPLLTGLVVATDRYAQYQQNKLNNTKTE